MHEGELSFKDTNRVMSNDIYLRGDASMRGYITIY